MQQRLEDNKRFAARNTKVPSLLQGLAACSSCGYGYYRTSATASSGKKIYYYRCLGSDDWRSHASFTEVRPSCPRSAAAIVVPGMTRTGCTAPLTFRVRIKASRPPSSPEWGPHTEAVVLVIAAPVPGRPGRVGR